MSCDCYSVIVSDNKHAQGNSVIMYRDAELRRYQYYVNPTWMGGVYASPSIAGSRYTSRPKAVMPCSTLIIGQAP